MALLSTTGFYPHLTLPWRPLRPTRQQRPRPHLVKLSQSQLLRLELVRGLEEDSWDLSSSIRSFSSRLAKFAQCALVPGKYAVVHSGSNSIHVNLAA